MQIITSAVIKGGTGKTTTAAALAQAAAQAIQQSLYQYAPRPKPAQDYKKLYEMIREG